MTDRYDNQFFDYLAEGSLESARVVVPLIQQWLPIESVLDVGCGRGAWLKIWRENGVEEIVGVDGDYVDTRSLLIPPENFQSADLERPIDLHRQFDLVTCLEVAEHLSEDIADSLIGCLCRHSDYVLFSAAVPGQGGASHINEQPYGYWKARFAACDFKMLDCIRPAVLGDSRVKRWYRYNVFLFVRDERLDTLPDKISATALGPRQTPRDISPTWYKLRKSLIRLLPLKIVNLLAAMNERWTRL